MWDMAAGMAGSYLLGKKKKGGGAPPGETLSSKLTQTGRRFNLNELQKYLGISEGRTQPWDLPEYSPMVETTRANTDRTLSNLPSILQRTGVSGPAAALTTEKVAGAGTDNLFNLINQLRTGAIQQGTQLAQGTEQNYRGQQAIDLQDKQIRSQDKWKQQQLIMEILKGLMAGGGAAVGAI